LVMASLICDLSRVQNAGEENLLRALSEYLDDSYVVYWNRELSGREFDVCILIPEIGVCVIEVKGWAESTVREVDRGEAILIKTDYGVESHNPRRQVRTYRNVVRNHIRSRLGRDLNVFHMVCYPFISRDFYLSKQMDLISELSITLLKEDLASREAFWEKFGELIRSNEGKTEHSLTPALFDQVRGLFEPGFRAEVGKEEVAVSDDSVEAHYSLLTFINGEGDWKAAIDEAVGHYMLGCKVILFVRSREMYDYAVKSIGDTLRSREIRPNAKGDLEWGRVSEDYSECQKNFFNWDLFVVEHVRFTGLPSFAVWDGETDSLRVERLLYELDETTPFNLRQYLIEHAPPDKNMVVKAGAGTGKTSVMISRIAFLCFSEGITASTLADRIVMLTFTNDAADNMKKRLKDRFRNYFMLTKDAKFLEMIVEIERMTIATIDKYVKYLLQEVALVKGLGRNFKVVSGNYERRLVVKQVLESYIQERKALDFDFELSTEIPMYELVDTLLGLVEQLENQKIPIYKLRERDFGENCGHEALHDLIVSVMVRQDWEYKRRLLENNQCDLKHFVPMLQELTEKDHVIEHSTFAEYEGSRFLFVDEFQDTDDAQIELIKKIRELGGYRLFVVGDIKQCIYRFRGAEVEAFGMLDVYPESWLEQSLYKNYRTAPELLDRFHKVFLGMSMHGDGLLVYNEEEDRLIPGRDTYRSNLVELRLIEVCDERDRRSKVSKEVRDVKRRLKELNEHMGLSPDERTIALLVRENWQAEELADYFRNQDNLIIETVAGQGLFQSPPALDLLKMLRALERPDKVAYYELAHSSFFKCMPPSKVELLAVSNDKNAIYGYMTSTFDQVLLGTAGKYGFRNWEEVVQATRTIPVLQLLQALYQQLQPWTNFSSDSWTRRFYEVNAHFLLEEIVSRVGLDSLTIAKLLRFMERNLWGNKQTECRYPEQTQDDVKILCTTVHKAKGLEYGHVILPYTDWNMDRRRKKGVRVTVTKDGKIGYCISRDNLRMKNAHFNEEAESAEIKKEEARILYVAMTRAMFGFSWVTRPGCKNSWSGLLEELRGNAI
jgi:DNA helicase-2/ATP-dependent DNA helicase PcrA